LDGDDALVTSTTTMNVLHSAASDVVSLLERHCCNVNVSEPTKLILGVYVILPPSPGFTWMTPFTGKTVILSLIPSDGGGRVNFVLTRMVETVSLAILRNGDVVTLLLSLSVLILLGLLLGCMTLVEVGNIGIGGDNGEVVGDNGEVVGDNGEVVGDNGEVVGDNGEVVGDNGEVVSVSSGAGVGSGVLHVSKNSVPLELTHTFGRSAANAGEVQTARRPPPEAGTVQYKQPAAVHKSHNVSESSVGDTAIASFTIA
jgi:hypothetical protein